MTDYPLPTISLPFDSNLWQAGVNPVFVNATEEKDWSNAHTRSLVVRPRGGFPHGGWIADCGHHADPEQIANARMLAAAPAMYCYLSELAREGDTLAQHLIKQASAAPLWTPDGKAIESVWEMP